MKHAITSSRWEIIGNRNLDSNHISFPLFFKQDMFTKEFTIYDSRTSLEISAGYDECKSLERAAVWEPEHIEDRLKDFFEGNSKKFLKTLFSMPNSA
ncbi:hypothetical protein [Acinetobacter sp. Ac_5812]|uniref:hypothetical protein n=1 Tax=Acinetobacter sp. Ac_5812 TaxID=1848937 RepID=UPI00149073CC|nr:hypothetical protein [Acinetobacter sp. Ac_5812]NNP69921.1 hypothetical protein [Acinetobacter sp. Ac_5812]